MNNNLPCLYAIVNIDQVLDCTKYVHSLCDAGVSLIQLRAKEISREDFKHIASDILREFRDKDKIKFIINDLPDLALELDAAGVHLGQEDADPIATRRLLGDHKIIGLSTHNEEQLRNAPYESLSYVALGPIFRSSTKNGHAPEVGLKELKRLSLLAKKPLVAIGGITSDNAKEVFEHGAESVAVVQDLLDSTNLKDTVSQYEKAKKESVN